MTRGSFPMPERLTKLRIMGTPISRSRVKAKSQLALQLLLRGFLLSLNPTG